MHGSDIKVPPLAELHKRHSEKWRGFPSDVLPLPVAEMDFEIAAPIQEVMIEMIKNSDLGYLGAIPEAGTAFAAFAERRWKWKLEPTDVHLATDVGVAAVEVLRVLVAPGDKVLVNSPIYTNFFNWNDEAKSHRIDVPFIYHPERSSDRNPWDLDWDGIEKAYSSGIKVHMICNPHNPLGRVYSADELDRFISLAHKHHVKIISDEIHAPLVLAPHTFTPLLSRPGAAEVAVTITAASKAWNIAGTKAAMIISQSETVREILKKMPMAVHYRASILGGFALATAFDKGEPWLNAAVEKIGSNAKFLQNILAAKIPAIRFSPPHSSYLAWLDCSALGLGDDPAKVFLEKGKVAFVAGHFYGETGRNFIRFNFATSEEIISNAIDRMVRSL